MNIHRLLIELGTDKRGVTAVEYGMIAALIVVVAIGGVALIGTDLSNVFQTIATES